jgi:5-methyltetrahydrofolate--homocysteine methyltransferase
MNQLPQPIKAYDFDVEKLWAYLRRIFDERIVLLDGGMGTQIQTYKLQEQDYRGTIQEFLDCPKEMKNNNDLLNITRPELVTEIHEAYLIAGADIVETNTFNGTWISQSDYGLEKYSYRMNFEASRLARVAADNVTSQEKDKPDARWRLVAGAVGPTNRTASVSPKVEDPAFRNVTFEELVDAYYEQIQGLVDGGSHIIFIETIFDTLNAKAGIVAYNKFFRNLGLPKLPLFLSGTIIDAAGRTLSGQDIEAFFISMMHADPFCIGLNCALGATQMYPFLQRLSKISHTNVHAYPNAGLPNAMGGYDETPENFATNAKLFCQNGLVNLVGGCCGTTPNYIAALWKAIQDIPRRELPPKSDIMMLSGMSSFILRDHIKFVNVGERCNISGSTKFKKMIKNDKYEEAISVAKDQVENGA